MPRGIGKKCASPQTGSQVLLTRRRAALRRTALTKDSTIKNKSKTGETSQATSSNDSTGQKLLRKRKRTISKKQADSSVGANESLMQKRTRRTVKPKAVHAANTKAPSKVKKGQLNNSESKDKNESGVKTRKAKRTSKNTSTLRQLSLKESFSNQAASRRLRSHKSVSKNHQNDTELIEKYISPDKQNLSVSVPKISAKRKAKVPIYKSIPLEDPVKDGSEIYDFKFDVNDSKERIARKKRKATIRRNVVKRLQKGVRVKANVQEKVTAGNVSKSIRTTKKRGKKSVRIVEEKTIIPATEEVQKDTVENAGKEQDKENLAPSQPATQTSPAEQTENKPSSKPTIVSIENISNKKVTLIDNSVMSNSGDFMPFRPTNVFNNKSILQEKNAPNVSFFEKSFSPILKSPATFDPGSPWRAPPLFTFSQVKNVFQSTPQNNKFDISHGRFSRAAKNESKTVANVMSANNVMQKNNENMQNVSKKNAENIGGERSFSVVNQRRKNVASERRFGTEITNLDHSAQTNTPVADVSERIIIEAETPLSSAPPQSNNVPVSTHSQSNSESAENSDKENTALNYQTPKKVSKKGLKKYPTRSPLKSIRNLQNVQQKENTKPASRLFAEKTPKFNVEPAREATMAPMRKPSIKSMAEPLVESTQKPVTESVPRPSETLISEVPLEPIPEPSKKPLLEVSKEPIPGPSKEPIPGPSKDPIPGPSKETVPELSTEPILEPIPGPSKEPERDPFKDPVPGPSGLQNLNREQRVLRQSNLNSFLNLADMPESTTIKTHHGIFDDPESPPISGKPANKSVESNVEIKTAFGFNEDDLDEDTSASTKVAVIEKKEERIPLRTITDNYNRKPLARLSLGEIRNNLLVKNARNKEKENQRIAAEKRVESKKPEKNKSPVKQKSKVVDIANFSDTFDILSETGDLSENMSDVPLFADLEPSHFTKPPKHSYKRKRALKHSFSDESSNEDDEVLEPEIKRKRVGKMKKEDEKRLKEWIDSVNQTFNEIDQHDLVVE